MAEEVTRYDPRVVYEPSWRPERDLTTISELVSLSEELGRLVGAKWFRGQASDEWDLNPKLHRPPNTARGWSTEATLTERFRQYAPTRRATCPPHDDYASWLFLMQHFGAPTRLLDWTESVLVATFFAVETHKELDARLFVLRPQRLNERFLQRQSIVSLQAEQHLIASAFLQRVMKSDALPKEEPSDDSKDGTKEMILAVTGHQVDQRMAAQSSVFTVHQRRSRGVPIGASNDPILRVFRIPKEHKEGLRAALQGLNINHLTLFPDLFGLGRQLASDFDSGEAIVEV
jgi:hypothetical protein